MKRVCLLVFLLLSCVISHAESSGIYYENADILAKCPSFCTFDDVPSPFLAGEAVSVYRILHPEAEESDAEIYDLIFARGEYTEVEAEPVFIDTVCSVESCTGQPDGSITISIRTESDWGFGYEFGFLADVTVDADGRILRVFIPE